MKRSEVKRRIFVSLLAWQGKPGRKCECGQPTRTARSILCKKCAKGRSQKSWRKSQAILRKRAKKHIAMVRATRTIRPDQLMAMPVEKFSKAIDDILASRVELW